MTKTKATPELISAMYAVEVYQKFAKQLKWRESEITDFVKENEALVKKAFSNRCHHEVAKGNESPDWDDFIKQAFYYYLANTKMESLIKDEIETLTKAEKRS